MKTSHATLANKTATGALVVWGLLQFFGLFISPLSALMVIWEIFTILAGLTLLVAAIAGLVLHFKLKSAGEQVVSTKKLLINYGAGLGVYIVILLIANATAQAKVDKIIHVEKTMVSFVASGMQDEYGFVPRFDDDTDNVIDDDAAGDEFVSEYLDETNPSSCEYLDVIAHDVSENNYPNTLFTVERRKGYLSCK